MKLHKKILIRGNMELLTGLHIGDSKDNVEIGGVDSPVIRRKDNNEPYIPGSSLKGKIRSLLEIGEGKNANSDFKNDGSFISELFGSLDSKEKKEGTNLPKFEGVPSRIIIRDSYLTERSSKMLSESEFTDMPFSEVKFENVIDRKTGTTKTGGIRQLERIPAGAEFDVEFVINIITETGQEDEADKKQKGFINLLKSGIRLLEDDYLGGSGSRGYGQVKFNIDWDKIRIEPVENYFNNEATV